MANTYTADGVTVTVADAERVAAWVRSLPQNAQGIADYEWNLSPQCPTGIATSVALTFARILGILGVAPFGATNAEGQRIGPGSPGWFSFVYPNTFVGPVVVSKDDDR